MSVDKEKARGYLVKLFSKALTEDEIANKRSRSYAILANYTSPKSGIKVNSLFDEQEIGDILSDILVAHTNARINALAKKIDSEGEF